MEDKQIVQLYWERNESAIQYTEQKYGRNPNVDSLNRR